MVLSVTIQPGNLARADLPHRGNKGLVGAHEVRRAKYNPRPRSHGQVENVADVQSMVSECSYVFDNLMIIYVDDCGRADFVPAAWPVFLAQRKPISRRKVDCLSEVPSHFYTTISWTARQFGPADSISAWSGITLGTGKCRAKMRVCEPKLVVVVKGDDKGGGRGGGRCW